MTTRTFLDGKVVLHCGDCVAVLATLEANCVDSIVCDPPYGLEFMGKEWDGADGFRRSLNAADAGRDSVFGRTSLKAPEYRTAGTGRKGKPGIGARDTEWVSNAGWNQFRCGTCGHLFHGGSPCQCENPQPVRADNRWNLFQEWCEAWARECLRVLKPGGYMLSFGGTKTQHRMVVAIEDAGFEIRDQIGWIYGQGFPKNDSSLKPAWEPVCVARKPLMGTVAANMAEHGTGRLNIDECRIDGAPSATRWGEMASLAPMSGTQSLEEQTSRPNLDRAAAIRPGDTQPTSFTMVRRKSWLHSQMPLGSRAICERLAAPDLPLDVLATCLHHTHTPLAWTKALPRASTMPPRLTPTIVLARSIRPSSRSI
jgi:hypothetical protein